MKARPGGYDAKAGSRTFQRLFQPQNTTPNATPIAAATTTSTVRHEAVASGPVVGCEVRVVVVICSLLSEVDGTRGLSSSPTYARDDRTGDGGVVTDSLRWHYPDQVGGSADGSALSALLRSPVVCSWCAT